MEQLKRICVLVERFPQRSETFVSRHAAALRASGHEVTVVSQGVGAGIAADELRELNRIGVKRVHYGAPSSRLGVVAGIVALLPRMPGIIGALRHREHWSGAELVTASRMHRLINETGANVLHIHFGIAAGPLYHLSKYAGALPPTVITWHGYDANVVPAARGAGIYAQLFAGGFEHTVGSRFMRDRLLTLGADAAKIHQIAMGVDLERFAFHDRKKEPGTPLRIVSVGRLHEVKGHSLLIKAVLLAKSRGVEVSLRIIGGGDLHDVLSAEITSSGLQANVELLGPRNPEEVLGELRRGHVFALTNVIASCGAQESQGVVFAEAQATGLPVIACDVGGVSESLVPGVTGFLCPPGDVAAVADAIESFARNPEIVATMGLSGREFVEERFSLSAMLQKFEAVYQSLGP